MERGADESHLCRYPGTWRWNWLPEWTKVEHFVVASDAMPGLQAMQERGRMQEGMVADIVILDAENVTEHANYKSGTNGLPSTGIPHVLVNGTVVVRNSEVLKDVSPGQSIRFPVEKKGRLIPVSGESWLRAYTVESNPEQVDLDDSTLN
jgi:hypothetical protein